MRNYGPTTHNIREYGAIGDGKTDDTSAIQAAINALPPSGGVVDVPAGEYMINALVSVRLRSSLWLRFAANAMFKAKPNASPKYYILVVDGVQDVTITDFMICGDRDLHDYSSGGTHEHGFGVHVRNSQRISLLDGRAYDCTGDGVCVGGGPGNEDILIQRVVGMHNRRQGLTIGQVKNIRVLDCEFCYTDGTAPQAGIDIEPDAGGETRTVFIDNCHLHNNKGAGLLIYTGATKPATVATVSATNNDIHHNSNGTETTRCSDLEFLRNHVHDNRASGMRFNAGSIGYVADNVFANNYTKNGPLARMPSKLFGWSKDIERDVLLTADSAINLGRNEFE